MATAVCDAKEGPLACFNNGCLSECAGETFLAFLGFVIVSMAGHMVGKVMAPLGLPTITVFIGFGLLCGPFGLGLVDARASSLLSWINPFALGFIGFSAGGHFHVSDMVSVIASASIIIASNVFVMVPGTFVAVYFLGGFFIPFFSLITSTQRIACSLLFACLSVARSPSSAIALIAELNARGPFTSTVLAVTVMMDVVVVMIFSIALTVARTLDPGDGGAEAGAEAARALSEAAGGAPGESAGAGAGAGTGGAGAGAGAGTDNLALSILLEFLSEVVFSSAFGALLGLLVPLIVGWAPGAVPWPAGPAGSSPRLTAVLLASAALVGQQALVLLQRLSLPTIGWALFYEEELAEEVEAFKGGAWLNPLIATMVAGFLVVNYTRGGHAFHETAEAISGPIFLLFFCYTGVSMNVGVLMRNATACVFIFSVRTALMFAANALGGAAAGAPPEFAGRYWMTFLTQAGVTLGLAKSAGAHFGWGEEFTASIVAVSVLNQVVGPVAMKRALRGAGEDHPNYHPDAAGGIDEKLGHAHVQVIARPQPRGAVVVAAPGDRSAARLATTLRGRGWSVLEVDDSLEVVAEGASTLELERLERHAARSLHRLPSKVHREVTAEHHEIVKPWSRIKHAMVVARAFGKDPLSRTTQRDAGAAADDAAAAAAPAQTPSSSAPPPPPPPPPRKARPSAHESANARQSLRRKSVQVQQAQRAAKRSSVIELLQAPPVAEMPESTEADPEHHAKCLRLLWLWAAMKSLSVVVCMLPSDEENLALCELIGDLAPMLSRAHMRSAPPQAVVTLEDADGADELLSHLHPRPLVIPRKVTLASLIAEVLHPEAHWTGTLKGSALEGTRRSAGAQAQMVGTNGGAGAGEGAADAAKGDRPGGGLREPTSSPGKNGDKEAAQSRDQAGERPPVRIRVMHELM